MVEKTIKICDRCDDNERKATSVCFVCSKDCCNNCIIAFNINVYDIHYLSFSDLDICTTCKYVMDDKLKDELFRKVFTSKVILDLKKIREKN